jgi:hypothetical protein
MSFTTLLDDLRARLRFAAHPGHARGRPSSRGGRSKPILRAEELEARTVPSATTGGIARALDLPAGATASYSGFPGMIQVKSFDDANGRLNFPTGRDEDFLVISTGDAATATRGGTGSGTDWGQPGAGDDVMTVTFTLRVPAGSGQQLKLDYRFLTNEPPDDSLYTGPDALSISVNGEFAPRVSANERDLVSTTNGAGGFARGSAVRTLAVPVPGGTTVTVRLVLADQGHPDRLTESGLVDSVALIDNVRVEAPQMVYLDFDHENTVVNFFGPHTVATIPAFHATDIVSIRPDAVVINEIVTGVKALYANLNVTFVTSRPASGDFMHVMIGGDNTVPLTVGDVTFIQALGGNSATYRQYYNAALGRDLTSPVAIGGESETVDEGNRNRNDRAVIFSKLIGQFFVLAPKPEIQARLIQTIAHEVGHNLGLRHVVDPGSIMMGAGVNALGATFRDALLPLTEHNWADHANEQNSWRALRGVLGPLRAVPFTDSYPVDTVLPRQHLILQFPAPQGYDALGLPVYNLVVGITGSGSLQSFADTPELMPSFFSVPGGSGRVEIELPRLYANPLFFFSGSTRPGGLVDVYSGTAVNGVLTFQQSLVPLYDASGALNTNIPVTIDTAGGLVSVGSAVLRSVAVNTDGGPGGNLVASGLDGSASVFVPDAAGQYPATPAASLVPFPGFAGQVRTTQADVDGDGFPDTVLVTGPGTPLRFAVVSGRDNTTLLVAPTAPFAGSEDFAGGGFVAAADLDGMGGAEVVVTPDQSGGPRVTIFSLAGGSATVRANFFGIDDANFRGGARAALGDVNGDGVADLAVCAGFLGGPRTALFDGTTLLATPTRLVGDFFAFLGSDATTLRNGVFVSAGDVDGDGFAELIFGAGPGGAPRVFVLSGQKVTAGDVAGAQASPVANFFVAGNSADRGGVRVAVKDADGDSRADVAVGSGEGSPAKIRVYLGASFASAGEPGAFQDLDLFGGIALAGGVYVG